ncbi:pyridine nucleotide-disulfide oxidoreductase [Betaproteobacteria bacterium SCGC AG-212-J23]|nr:pyridine nucleotide-disulfide oxidoreductase [Betaproteobacteria bacterium SCGC AG-212-J23]
MSLPSVIIVGCGFGGLWAAEGLRRAPAAVTVIDRTNHHLFTPLLYQVATAGLSAPSISAPIRHILERQKNATVLLGEVREIVPQQRHVVLEDRTTVAYDYLVVASGSINHYFGHDDWAPFAPGLKTLDEALDIRARVLTAFERAEREADAAKRSAWLTFVVIGGGATGVELAGTLAEIARHTLKGEFRRVDPTRARVVLVEGTDRVLPPYTPALSEKARLQLERLGVTVWLGKRVTGVDAGGVALGAERLEAKTVIWAAGITSSPLGRPLGAPLDRAGRVQVEPDLSVPGHPEIFVVGDLAAVPGVPGVAPAAKQMGRHAAANIVRSLKKQATREFKYKDYGQLATIGRNAAVAMFGKLELSGYPAWLMWLLAHIYFLINFRNRLAVMIDWAWSYWTYNRGARIILKGPS